MIKKYILIILTLLLGCGALTWRSCAPQKHLSSSTDDSQASLVKDACPSPDLGCATNKGIYSINSDTSLCEAWTKDGLKRTKELLLRLKKQKETDFDSGTLKEGMTSENNAIECARARIDFRNYDRSQDPTVLLFDECYVVLFSDFPNPYRAGKNTINTRVVVDAWTGEAIGLRHARGGPGIHLLDPKTPGDSEEETLSNKTKMRTAGNELNKRIKYGQPLNSEPQADMVPPEMAIGTARQYAVSRNRNFDLNQEPQAVLIDDVYFIVLWRHPDRVSERGVIYDSRVGIDAKTGKVLAMEITRYSKSNPEE